MHEALSTLWSASVWARSHDNSLDLESLVGQDASFRVEHGYAHVQGGHRVWSGVVRYLELGQGDAGARLLNGPPGRVNFGAPQANGLGAAALSISDRRGF